MRPGFLAVAAVALLAGAADDAAGAADFRASGYLKTLYSYARSPLDRAPYRLDLNRARASLEASAGSDRRLEAHVDYDHEIRAGSYLASPQYRAAGLAEPPTYLDMQQTIGSGDSFSWRHLLYRGWAGYEGPESVARFGRQRIAWGTGKLWNPTDVLNPYVPTALERDERRGVDAAYARRGLGDLGQAEGAWALGDRWSSTDLLGRVRGHWLRADVSAMGGKVAASTSSWMVGSDFSCDLWEGNLHGEWSYTDPQTRTPYWRAVVGYEYTFSSALPWLRDAWVLGEYFHNGAGALQTARYQPGLLLSGRDTALARDYAGVGFSKDLHPLVKLEFYGIVNLGDGSSFLGPLMTWNALGNLYLGAGLQRFGGALVTEFGRLPNIAFAQAQYYF